MPYAQRNEVFQSVLGSGAGKINHVVYIVQENRSFDDMFQGYPGADTVSSGKTSKGQRIKLPPVALRRSTKSITRRTRCSRPATEPANCPERSAAWTDSIASSSTAALRNGQYVYVPHSETKPYFDMAHEWVLADRMFASQLDESFVAHQYIIAAQAHSSVNVPDSFWGCEGGPGDEVATITHQRTYGNAQTAVFRLQNAGRRARCRQPPVALLHQLVHEYR